MQQEATDLTAKADKTGRLVGVYNADGGLLGELAYITGKITGRCHCALCDITHGSNPLGKREWKQLTAQLPLPFSAVHLNEMPAEVAAAMAGVQAPAIVLVKDNEAEVLITDSELEACQKKPSALAELIEKKII